MEAELSWYVQNRDLIWWLLHTYGQVNGLMQKRCNSDALELRLVCINVVDVFAQDLDYELLNPLWDGS